MAGPNTLTYAVTRDPEVLESQVRRIRTIVEVAVALEPPLDVAEADDEPDVRFVCRETFTPPPSGTGELSMQFSPHSPDGPPLMLTYPVGPMMINYVPEGDGDPSENIVEFFRQFLMLMIRRKHPQYQNGWLGAAENVLTTLQQILDENTHLRNLLQQALGDVDDANYTIEQLTRERDNLKEELYRKKKGTSVPVIVAIIGAITALLVPIEAKLLADDDPVKQTQVNADTAAQKCKEVIKINNMYGDIDLTPPEPPARTP